MLTKEYQSELFRNELDIIESGKSNLNDEKYKTSLLLDRYKVLLKEYENLLKITKKTFNISDSQGNELKRREAEIKNILDNSNQGFLTFGKNLMVNKEYSAECIKIFDRKIAGVNIIELLSNFNNEQNELFQLMFREIFEIDNLEIKYSCLKKLPNMLKINDNFINIQYRLIENGINNIDNESIMLILTDITEKKKTEDQVLYLSYHDKLTSLYNRAYIESIIPQFQSQHNMPLSVIMGDLNGLKLTNDVFGHENGDILLINAGKVFMNSCRRNDIVARWGGDEFIIILPGTNEIMVKKIYERIKDACNQVSISPINLSISLGTATMENSDTNISELFNIAENMMYSNKLEESKAVRRKIIMGLEKTLYEKCYEDRGHVKRMKKMALNFSKCLKIESESIDMANMEWVVTLHDIGKVAIPKDILGKPGKLSQTEWEIMKSYTEIGYRMAQSIEEPILAQSILSMHERWDGTGYPYGLIEDQIPFEARVLSIIEAFDVMTHDRPYKKALNKETALRELSEFSGKQFDPNLLSIFLKSIDEII